MVPWAPGRADYAKKINLGFRQTQNEWIFSGADDIRFQAGWDTTALALGTQKRVIGTNDLHNPLVRRGRSSTHTLFARSYIEEYGGTLDDTGTVLCELYDHQYVDSEFCEVAKRRGEFIFSHNSIVEHIHPDWDHSVRRDATYVKGRRATGRDRQLYIQRMGLERGRRRSNRPRA